MSLSDFIDEDISELTIILIGFVAHQSRDHRFDSQGISRKLKEKHYQYKLFDKDKILGLTKRPNTLYRIEDTRKTFRTIPSL